MDFDKMKRILKKASKYSDVGRKLMRKPRDSISVCVCVFIERAMLLATVPKSFSCPPSRREESKYQ